MRFIGYENQIHACVQCKSSFPGMLLQLRIGNFIVPYKFGRQFPKGEMITKLFPVLVANPLCVDVDGAPISYESYGFSPRQASLGSP